MDTNEIYILEEDNALPPLPGCCSMPLSVFKEMLYKFASKEGYEGSEEEFYKSFMNALNSSGNTGCDCKCVKSDIFFFENIKEFPVIGKPHNVYVDKETGNLYFWDDSQYVLIPEKTPEKEQEFYVKDIEKLVVGYLETITVDRLF